VIVFSLNLLNRSDIEYLFLEGPANFGEGNQLDNFIQGNIQNDFLSGLGGNDTIRGGSGNDTIRGGSGNDLILGRLGEDVLFGGLNGDTFAFTWFNLSEGVDSIADFNSSEGDKIGIGSNFGATSISQFSTNLDGSGNINLLFDYQELAIIQKPASGFDLNTDLVFLGFPT